MTQEEKAKAYDEALEKAKMYYKNAKEAGDYSAVARYENIFPELRKSEDEKTLNEIITFIEQALHSGGGVSVSKEKENKWLAYLEKQKEETENATKTLAKILKDSAEGFRRILKKKGIDYEVSNEFWENTAVVYSKEEDVEFHKWMDDLMGPTSVEETYGYKKGLEAGMKQKEQKPVECIEFSDNEFKNQVSHLLASVINKEQEYNRGFVEYAAQSLLGYAKHEIKPVEWSQDDTRNLNRALFYAREYQRTNDVTYGTEECIAWLEFLRSRLSERPKKDLAKIKSKIILALHHATNCTDAQNAIKKTGVDVADVADWLFEQDDNSAPHWKPSEEQIEAVRYFVNRHQSEAWAATGQWKQFTALRGLLGILQKLK